MNEECDVDTVDTVDTVTAIRKATLYIRYENDWKDFELKVHLSL